MGLHGEKDKALLIDTNLQLVWMVCSGQDSLDYAHYRHWDIWLCIYDDLVRTIIVLEFLSDEMSSLPIQLYLADAFAYAASALSAASVCRLILPYAGQMAHPS